jgi:hypothetical protein
MQTPNFQVPDSSGHFRLSQDDGRQEEPAVSSAAAPSFLPSFAFFAPRPGVLHTAKGGHTFDLTLFFLRAVRARHADHRHTFLRLFLNLQREGGNHRGCASQQQH